MGNFYFVISSWFANVTDFKHSYMLLLVGEKINLLKMNRGAVNNN